jgi:4-diphosphocytidyl-2-C-methyl-D-erythritol kinase
MTIFCILLIAILLSEVRSFKNTLRLSNIRSGASLSSSSSPKSGDYDLTLRSPCKINLFLRILGRRPNGYHDLASLFQAISFSDYMHFSKLPASAVEDQMICSDTSLAVDKSNLVIKALDLMRAKTGVQQHFKVYLDKKVPMQAGLGGGR